jgi:lipopolysaccharide export system protein LptC
MSGRWKTALILIPLAIFSAWFLERLSEDDNVRKNLLSHDPDYYMEDFTTLTMNQDGTPKNKLFADYMAHYQDDDTTELLEPKLEIYRDNKPPIFVTADKGWVTADNEVILLTGDVYLRQDDINGVLELEIITSDARILLEQNYAETDKPITITGKRTTVKSVGIRAYLQQERFELLNNVHTKIEPKKQI